MLDYFGASASCSSDVTIPWEGNEYPWEGGNIYLFLRGGVDQQIQHIVKTHTFTESDSN